MKERQSWISFLRITATMAVVWLHTNGTIWGNQDLFPLSEDQIHFFAVNYYLMYWAVPVFFMMTGALLLQKDNTISISYCLRRYVSRMCLVLLIFGTGYSFIMLWASGEDRGATIIVRALANVLTGKTFAHLWYCYEMIGVYIALPIMKAFVDRADQKTRRLSCFILFVFDFWIPFLSGVIGAQISLYLPLSYSIFYVLLGHELNDYRIDIGKTNLCMLMVGVAVLIGVLAYLNPIEGNPLIGYNSPVIALMAASIFILYKRARSSVNMETIIYNGTKKGKLLWKMDRLCFGVYLIHPLFIQVMYRVLGLSPIRFRRYQMGTLIIWFVVVALSYISSFFIRKIRIFEKYML